jgi:hypothetical protein
MLLVNKRTIQLFVRGKGSRQFLFSLVPSRKNSPLLKIDKMLESKLRKPGIL